MPEAVAIELRPALMEAADEWVPTTEPGWEACSPALLRALVEIGAQIQAEEVHADTVLQLIVDRTRELCASDVAWIALVDEHAERLRVFAASGASTAEFLQMAVRVGSGVGGAAVAKGRTILVRDRDLFDNDWPGSVRHALEDEGVVSVLCSPMLRSGRMVGALYLGSRSPTAFGPTEVTLLPALATQAAIAIENGRLYQALSEKNDALEQAAAIHRQLTDASLAGAGLGRVAGDLAALVERDVVVQRGGGAVRYGPDGSATAVPDEPAAAPERLPITAGDTQLGTLWALGDVPLSPLQLRALEHGATVIALELVKQRAALEVEWRLQGELLEELLQCRGEPSAGLLARAEHAGIDLAEPRRIAVLAPAREADHDYLLGLARRAPAEAGAMLVARRGGLLVLAIPDASETAAEARVRAIQRKAQRAGIACCAGLSDRRTSLPVALAEAEAALGLARTGPDADTLVRCEALGPLRFLLDARDTSEMSAYVASALGPLAEHDRGPQRMALLPTLRAYLEADGHQPTTAAACHIHVSSLKYRIARIAEVLGRSPQDPQTRFELRLAFAVRDVLASLGGDPFARPSETNRA